MTVARMLHVTVLGYRPVLDDVVATLQREGVLQVAAVDYGVQSEEIGPADERFRRLDEQVSQAHFARDFLARYHVNEQAFSVFVTEKFHFERDEYLALTFNSHFHRVYRECVNIADKLAAGEREVERLTQLVRDLEPWRDLHYQISEWRHTGRTKLFTGTVPAAESAEIRQRLRETLPEVSVDELGPVGDRQAWVVIVHECCESDVRSVLSSSDFAEVTFPGLTDYPAEEIAEAQAQVEELQRQAAVLVERAKELADENYHQAVGLVQSLDTRRDQLSVRKDFGRTDRAFVISGWVPEDHSATLEKALERFSGDVDLTLEEPGEDDDPPVQLRNPRWLQPLEVLTDLYGRPPYGEIDPTPLLAPFFLVFFGICIGDVGYGAMLIVGSWLIKTRLDVGPGVKRFLTLMTYGGAVAMLFGVAFASYFALPVDTLPKFLADLQLIDPLNELTTFLLFTLVLGIVQVFFGVLVAAWNAVRRGDPSEAVFGQLSTLFLFAMIAVYVVTGEGLALSGGLIGTMIMQGRAVQAALRSDGAPIWDRVLGVAWLAAVVVSTVLMGTGQVTLGLALIAGASVLLGVVSKTSRAGVFALLGGLYAVYGMSAFVGDTLSYTRLAALGLSGSLVGFVFNILAGLVWGPAGALFERGGVSIVLGVVVALLAIAIFVVGHVFNVVINLLGAFVHPARLQFVEFFSKFYEAGGEPFSPFRVRSEDLVLEAGTAGSEGGAG